MEKKSFFKRIFGGKRKYITLGVAVILILIVFTFTTSN